MVPPRRSGPSPSRPESASPRSGSSRAGSSSPRARSSPRSRWSAGSVRPSRKRRRERDLSARLLITRIARAHRGDRRHRRRSDRRLPARPALSENARRAGPRRKAERLPARPDEARQGARPKPARLGRPDRGYRALGAAPRGERAPDVPGLQRELHAPGVPSELAGRREDLPLPVSRRGLLRGRDRCGRSAAAAALRTRVGGQRRPAPRAAATAPDREAGMRSLRSLLDRCASWLGERFELEDSVLVVLRHPVPRELERPIGWWYVTGSATLAVFVVQVVTGVGLAMTYVPAPNSAYDSLQFISHDATLGARSEEHTSELQSQSNLVCRLLLEKKKSAGPSAALYWNLFAATWIYGHQTPSSQRGRRLGHGPTPARQPTPSGAEGPTYSRLATLT